jgi:hypothetical protein
MWAAEFLVAIIAAGISFVLVFAVFCFVWTAFFGDN